eukprot:TRINITY_DN9580_c0_g1_i1.p1 TRINITY_DN9580_c0_g1~~TRINITY_DN9580_c0_g1_i1.p1  ORF type:complete len:348 (+),score=56.02 TRINITY_DN9580_c0_g1_i1:43-1044(+)
MMIKILFCLVVLFAFTVSARPCTRCLWEGAYCGSSSGGQCLAGLKCTTLKHGSAAVCLPTVGPGEACNNRPYDPCPSSYTCDSNTQTCVLIPSTAGINDGCTISADCIGSSSGVTCTGGVCTKPSNISCSITGCPYGKFCDTNVIGDPICRDELLPGAACNDGIDKCFNGECSNGLCEGYFTKSEGTNCTMTFECEVGLACYEKNSMTTCNKPSYHYITPTDFGRWGAECDGSTSVVGCSCNYASGQEQFVIEANAAYTEPCKTASFRAFDCLKEHECYTDSFFENSCTRNNCYGEYTDYTNQCYFGGATPPRCSATSMMLALIFIIAVLFLH